MGDAHTFKEPFTLDEPVTLACGQAVNLRAFVTGQIYAGLYVWCPGRPYIQELLAEKVEMVAELWGHKRVIVLPPKLDNSHPNYPKMSPLWAAVWLTCKQPPTWDADEQGSQAILLWTFSERIDKTIREIIVEGLRDLKWWDVATGYSD